MTGQDLIFVSSLWFKGLHYGQYILTRSLPNYQEIYTKQRFICITSDSQMGYTLEVFLPKCCS